MSSAHDPAPSSSAPGGATPPASTKPRHFVDEIVQTDLASGKWGRWTAQTAPRPELVGAPRITTRFPPEPNGYLHIGHAKSICLNYSLAQTHGGTFNLRFDDTNPEKEELEYVEGIKRDVRWITSAFGGSYDHGPHAGGVYWASERFDEMFDMAMDLIKAGLAYVCQLTPEQMSEMRGTTKVPGRSPFRERPIEESVRLFQEMREGKHAEGSMTLRAKCDLASPNFNLRDPVMYRVMHAEHHNTGAAWKIYPMYDWAHGIEDSLECVTHSICTLEFENHRPLYDWFMRAINFVRGGSPKPPVTSFELGGSGPIAPGQPIWHSQQIEFAKLQFTYTVLSKRNMLKMVKEGVVKSWDDPRMPTICAFRRRGYTPASIRNLCEEVGVTKFDSVIDFGRLEQSIRADLNASALRTMCVLRPIKLKITNWPQGKVDELDYVINPEKPELGTRKVPFTGELFIEQEDFAEVPPKKFFRLYPGNEVRLRWAYFVTCTGIEKDAAGNITQILCTYDPATRGGDAPVGPDGNPAKKVKGTLHWISAQHAIDGEVRLFDRLFKVENPGDRTGDWHDDLNENSLEVITAAKLDPWLLTVATYDRQNLEGTKFQFERMGYFCVDPDTTASRLVFNRVVTLKDAWVKEAGK